MSDYEIPNKEWWNTLTPSLQEDILKRLEFARSHRKHGDKRIDGFSFCPRCGSPDYVMYRMSEVLQARTDDPHYYGKHCYTCGYSFDPKRGVSK